MLKALLTVGLIFHGGLVLASAPDCPIGDDEGAVVEKVEQLGDRWTRLARGEIAGNPDFVVQTSAAVAHTSWYEGRQNSEKKDVPNPKELKAKFLGTRTPELYFAEVAKPYPSTSLANGKIVQDINRPVEQILPALNEQLNGGLARQRMNRVVKALASNPVLTTAVVEELSDGAHVDWMGSSQWEFASACEDSAEFKATMKKHLGFDWDAIKARGDDPGSVIYEIKLDRIIDFVKRELPKDVLATLPAKRAETISQYAHYPELSRTEQLKDVRLILQTIELFAHSAR